MSLNKENTINGCVTCFGPANETILCKICKICYFCSFECKIQHTRNNHTGDATTMKVYLNDEGQVDDIKIEEEEENEVIHTDISIFMTWKNEHDSLFKLGLIDFFKNYNKENVLIFTRDHKQFIVQTLNDMLGSAESEDMTDQYIFNIIQLHASAESNQVCLMIPPYKENKIPYFSVLAVPDKIIAMYKQMA